MANLENYCKGTLYHKKHNFLNAHECFAPKTVKMQLQKTIFYLFSGSLK